MLDVDALAQEIRRVDGSNSLGAGTLAEALMPFLEATGEAKPVAWMDDGTLRAGSEKTAHRIITDEQKSGMPAAVSASFNVPLFAAPVPATPAQGVVALHTAAAVLVAKLDGIHADPDYRRVWEIAQLHGGKYIGPNYINELASLRAALASREAGQ